MTESQSLPNKLIDGFAIFSERNVAQADAFMCDGEIRLQFQSLLVLCQGFLELALHEKHMSYVLFYARKEDGVKALGYPQMD